MIDTTIKFEKFLQNQRFKRVKRYLYGDVIDFGGNRGELKPFVSGQYTVVNYDHTPLKTLKADTIISLAVFEHMTVEEVYEVMKLFKKALRLNGKIFITTPTLISHPVLWILSRVGILEKENIDEHKHYWNKKELNNLAKKNGFKMTEYAKFQLGFNQFAVFERDIG